MWIELLVGTGLLLLAGIGLLYHVGDFSVTRSVDWRRASNRLGGE